MNYEKIIVELLGRIQVLEEQVAALQAAQNSVVTKKSHKITTTDIRDFIQQLKVDAKAAGKTSIILKSGDIHNDLGLKSALPQVCNAMRQSMNAGDVVLYTTPSGNSSTIKIEYKL